MTTPHVYQIYLRATPDQVWTAITDSDWTERWFHRTRWDAPPVPGPYRTTIQPDGEPAVDGELEVVEPPTADRPGRLVQTWHVLYDAALAAEHPGRVEWTVSAAGDGLTLVRLVHGDLFGSPLTWAAVEDGWVWVLDSLKTVLETGSPLPRAATTGAPTDAAAVAADWHRRQGVEANNAAMDRLEALTAPVAPADAEDLLRTAYAAAYHWDRAADRTPVNAVRADYLLARALTVAGQPGPGLVAADRCLTGCLAAGLADFDLAYAHLARAAALQALGRGAEADQERVAAREVPVADAEDRGLLEADLSRV